MKIVAASHLDHNLSPAHVAWLEETFGAREAFFIETVELPARLADLECGLHGPLMGDAPVGDDEVELLKRGTRDGLSRMTACTPRPTRLVTVIAGPHAGEPCVLFTAFGGPVAPREPFDAAFADGKDAEGLAESVAFWSVHALSK